MVNLDDIVVSQEANVRPKYPLRFFFSQILCFIRKSSWRPRDASNVAHSPDSIQIAFFSRRYLRVSGGLLSADWWGKGKWLFPNILRMTPTFTNSRVWHQAIRPVDPSQVRAATQLT